MEDFKARFINGKRQLAQDPHFLFHITPHVTRSVETHSRLRKIKLQKATLSNGVNVTSKTTHVPMSTLRDYSKQESFEKTIPKMKIRCPGGGRKPLLTSLEKDLLKIKIQEYQKKNSDEIWLSNVSAMALSLLLDQYVKDKADNILDRWSTDRLHAALDPMNHFNESWASKFCKARKIKVVQF